MDDSAFDTLTFDQQRLLDALLRVGADFLIMGGYAVRAYGCLRATTDLDLVVATSEANLGAVREALNAVDAIRVDDAVEELRSNADARVSWNDCDLFPRSSQFTFADLLAEATPVRFDERAVLLISRSQLICEKRHWSSQSNRGAKGLRDQRDLECLLSGNRAAG